MKMRGEESDHATLLHLDGVLRDGDDLISTIGRLMDEDHRPIVLDLSRVEMISSAGLGALVQLNARANTQGTRIVLASPSPFVQGVLQTTKLDRFFDVHKSLEAALAAVK
ncbi:MAG: STAS domain-containing protein [Phycisphaerae bacterium]